MAKNRDISYDTAPLKRWKLDSSRRRNYAFTDRLCLPKIELSEVEIDSLMFFNVPLFIFLNEIQGKTFVTEEEHLVLHTDALVLTFHLETEAICI